MQIALTQQALEDIRLKIYQGWSAQTFLRSMQRDEKDPAKAAAIEESVVQVCCGHL